jgi:hypothetical protein
MSFAAVKAALIKRLDEGDRGDRAWWLLTRVHLSASRLQEIASYLSDASGGEALVLTSNHYAALGKLLEITNANPRQTINRHYFLAMETPLRLIRRTNPHSWDEIILTAAGRQLATGNNSPALFENLLGDIRFCKEPWYSAGRAAEYSAFNVHPYPAMLTIMRANSGYIDLDEFDLFASRVRSQAEVPGASQSIAEFRTFNEAQKAELRKEVADRIPAGAGTDSRKPYNNWRDMARHTFSLFALGESTYRDINELLLSKTLTSTVPKKPTASAVSIKSTIPSTTAATPKVSSTPSKAGPARSKTVLLLPNVEAPADLLTPPIVTQSNTGTESELLIGKILAADGWQVVYYNQRRGYGFDLWAKKGTVAVIIEVKSFLETASSVALTALEHEAARHHKDNFLLVIVENVASGKPTIHVIQDPAHSLNFTPRNTSHYSATRSEWEPKASKSLPT